MSIGGTTMVGEVSPPSPNDPPYPPTPPSTTQHNTPQQQHDNDNDSDIDWKDIETHILQLDHTTLSNIIKPNTQQQHSNIHLDNGTHAELTSFILYKTKQLIQHKQHEHTHIAPFFQFYAYLTYLFDSAKFPAFSWFSANICSNDALIKQVVDVSLAYIVNLCNIAKQSPNGVELWIITCLSNIMTIIQNHIGFDFPAILSCNRALFCEYIRNCDQLQDSLVGLVHVCFLDIGPGENFVQLHRSKEINKFFCKHSVEFFNAVLNWKVVGESAFQILSAAIVQTEKFANLFNYIIDQIQSKDQEASFFLKLLCDSSSFFRLLDENSSSPLVAHLLDCVLSCLQTLLRKVELGEPEEMSLELLDCLIDLLVSSPFVHEKLFTSPTHRSALVSFIENIVYRRTFLSPEGFKAPNESFEVASKVRQTKAVVTVFQLFCALFDSNHLFLQLLKERFLDMQARLKLIEFLRQLKSHPYLEIGPSIRIHENDKVQFERLVYSVKSLDSPLPSDSQALPIGDFNFHAFAERVGFQFTSKNDYKCSPWNIDSPTKNFLPESLHHFVHEHTLPPLSASLLSEAKGWGLKNHSFVPSNSIIAEVVGEVYDLNEYIENRVSQPHPYLFKLDSRHVIDCFRHGNISRCVNHSHDPNARLCSFQEEGSLPRLFIVSLKEIPAGSEITIDYSDWVFGPPDDSPIKCSCGTPLCHGSVPFCNSRLVQSQNSESRLNSLAGNKRRIDEISASLERQEGELHSNKLFNASQSISPAKPNFSVITQEHGSFDEIVDRVDSPVKSNRVASPSENPHPSGAEVSVISHTLTAENDLTIDNMVEESSIQADASLNDEKSLDQLEKQSDSSVREVAGNVNTSPHGEIPKVSAKAEIHRLAKIQENLFRHADGSVFVSFDKSLPKPSVSFPPNDEVLDFNKARGFRWRQCTHAAVARGIREHMNYRIRAEQQQQQAPRVSSGTNHVPLPNVLPPVGPSAGPHKGYSVATSAEKRYNYPPVRNPPSNDYYERTLAETSGLPVRTHQAAAGSRRNARGQEEWNTAASNYDTYYDDSRNIYGRETRAIPGTGVVRRISYPDSHPPYHDPMTRSNGGTTGSYRPGGPLGVSHNSQYRGNNYVMDGGSYGGASGLYHGGGGVGHMDANVRGAAPPGSMYDLEARGYGVSGGGVYRTDSGGSTVGYSGVVPSRGMYSQYVRGGRGGGRGGVQ